MSVFQELSHPFPKEVERQLRKGGTSLTYIPVSEVITRLNKVLGVDMWSYEIIHCGRDQHDPDFIVAHVRLTAQFVPTNDAPLITVTKDGIGGQKIKRTKSGDIVDLGDEMKGAVSDALKKAAQHLGVGLYLARTEDSLAVEEAEEVGDQPISTEHYEKLREVLNNLSDDAKIVMKNYWEELTEGKPFSNEYVTNNLLSTLLSRAKQLKSEE